MLRKRCQLCGGKLDHNNICTLCGLDNSKTDSNYKVNQSACDHQPLTHVHKSETIPKRKRPKQKGSAFGKVLFVVCIVILFLQIIPFVHYVNPGTGMLETVEKITDNMINDTVYVDEDSQYLLVTRSLSEEGEQYETLLENGTYIVGVHIPEGTYRVEEETAITYSGFGLEDEENQIYLGESFNDDDRKESIEDVRCYTGAKLSVRGNVYFISSNAQVDEMSALENPLTDMATVENGDVAGEDFPAGTYDVVMNGGDTSFAYLVPGTVWSDPDIESESVTERFWIDTDSGEFVKRNIYMPEGTKIFIDNGSVQLIPSEKIPESYDGYYYIYE